MTSGTRFVDKSKYVNALHSVVPSAAAPKWVSLKGYNHATIIIDFLNTTTVTGAAIGLAQATSVSGAGTKVLPFTKYWLVADDAASAVLVETAVVANTFTMPAVNSKSGYAIIEVDSWTLDVANLFTAIQVTIGNAVAQTIDARYILGNVPRYAGEPSYFVNPLAD